MEFDAAFHAYSRQCEGPYQSPGDISIAPPVNPPMSTLSVCITLLSCSRLLGQPLPLSAASANFPSAQPGMCMLENGFDVFYFFCAAATSATDGLLSNAEL